MTGLDLHRPREPWRTALASDPTNRPQLSWRATTGLTCPASLVDVLTEIAEHSRDERAFTFLDGDGATCSLSFGELDARARAVAAALGETARPGERALVACPSGIEFVVGFYGCLYAGVIAVPCPPARMAKHIDRLLAVVAEAQPAVALTVADFAPGLRDGLAERRSGRPVLIVEEVADNLAGGVGPVEVGPDDIAFLQFTSGSTRSPRGVMVSHGNLIANCRMAVHPCGLSHEGEFVSWLPVFHDMGLIGTLLNAQILRVPATLMAPETFMADPLRWLRAVSDCRRPVFSAAPNFALELVAQRAGADRDAVADLELGHWVSLVCGSEPIRRSTLDRFATALAPAGFSRDALHAAYGMAEATLMVCAERGSSVALEADADALSRGQLCDADTSAGARQAQLVGCGPVPENAEIAVVDPQTREPRPDGVVGELWVRGPHVAAGYWGRTEESEETFGATLRTGGERFLRTGDLGVRREGEHFVTGRLKDIVIVQGRNVYPEDVEYAARNAHELTSTELCAAFSSPVGDGEGLVIVQGIPIAAADCAPAIAEALRCAVLEACDVEPRTIVLTRSARLPRTTSGKVRRSQCREDWLSGRLPVLHETNADPLEPGSEELPAAPEAAPGRDELRALDVAAREPTLRLWLSARVAALGRLPVWQVDPERPLPALGLDSLKFARLSAEVADGLGIALSGRSRTVGELASELAAALEAAPISSAQEATADAETARGEDASEPFALTDLQQAYLHGRGAAYELGGVGAHAYLEFEADGLDPERLAAAWWQLVEHHEMLRAVITDDGRQRVLALDQIDATTFGLQIVDLRALEGERVREALLAERGQMSHEVLDATRGPLYRLRLSVLGDGRARLHVSFDLLITDLWSIQLLLDQWGVLYRAPEHSLPALRGDFRTWVQAQAAAKEAGGADIAAARRYWQERAELMPLPPELPRLGGTGPPRFVRRERRLDASAVARLGERAREQGVTLSVALLSAYAATLARWSRSRRLRIGVTLFDRPADAPQLADVVGDFTSVDVLAVDAREPSSFAQLADTVQRRLWEDLAHRAYSGVQVLRDIAHREQRGTGVALPVIFTSGIATGRARPPRSWLGPLAWGVSQTPQVLLDHQVIEDGDGLLLTWDAVEAQFPDGVLDAMFVAHGELLAQLADGDGWAGEPLAATPAADLRRQAEANHSARPLAAGLLHEPLLAAARDHPHALAVIAPDHTLDFEELATRAAALAGELAAAGAGPGTLVGLCLPKGWRQVVAALAVLRAGAAYLPIDPELPLVRRTLLAEQAGIVALVQDEDHGPWPDGVALITPAEERPREAASAPDPTAVQPGDRAYVIYTSGSTGMPKGVAVSHGAARNTCADICARWGFGPDDRVLGLSSLSFDLSVFDIFGVLGAGGALVLPAPAAQRDAGRWLELIDEHGITVWNSVPALAEMLVAEHGAGERRPLPLRLAMLSGDWIATQLPPRLRAAAPDVEVVSLGGATEAGIWSIAHPAGDPLEGWDSVPYGRALANQTVWVLDEAREQCPEWVTGELYIGGAGLADGYHDDPERTAERFVTRPKTGERLYRTGDLGRWRPDGVIEFLGREDSQVKLGGHRIELGEIEQALIAHPGVRGAAVVAIGERHQRRLVGIVVREAAGVDPATDGAAAPDLGGAGDGLIADPLRRLEFKAARTGRRAAGERPTVELDAPAPWWENGLSARASVRAFASEPLELGSLGRLLAALRAHEDGGPLPRHAYASAGGLYPVQVYVEVRDRRVDDLDAGVYYYDPDAHRLVALRGAPAPLLRTPGNDWVADGPAFLILLVARGAAIEPLYGPLSRDLSLIEAGLVSQLLESAAPGHGLGLCQIGAAIPAEGFADGLELDDSHELLHVLAGGTPALDHDRPAGTAAVTSETLREQIATRLPAYMVPSSLVFVDELPLTPTGKLDRHELVTLAARAASASAVGYVAPAGEIERAVAEEAAAVLGIERVSSTDNFFDVGANSALLVELYSRLRARLGTEFPLMTMFESPNARALAAQIRDASGEGAAARRGEERAARRRSAARRRRPARPEEESR